MRMTQQSAQPADRQPDRRKSPRLLVRGRLLGCLLETDRPVRIREIGLGGFVTETIDPLPVSVRHEVRFTTEDDESAVIAAVSLHSWPSCASDGTPCFVTGFEFRPDDPVEAQRVVRMLIEKVTAVGLYTAD
jgi:hypothetical protein